MVVKQKSDTDLPVNGSIREHDGKICIFYDGYWMRYYAPPPNTMAEKRELIYSLQRRVFHHTEEGINSPGWRLDLARKAYEAESDPIRKRVNAAMLAGSLFNRAADIFTLAVNMEEKGIHVTEENELMRQCEACFMEALQLGKQVKHFSGEEGVDELWGEPFKAFSMPLDKFFLSRYVKLAQTFAAIDCVIDRMLTIYKSMSGFEAVIPLLEEFRDAAKIEAETIRSDDAIYTIWPRYVAAKEAISTFKPQGLSADDKQMLRFWEDGLRLLNLGKEVVSCLAGVRVPMPVTTANFMSTCDLYVQTGSLDSEFAIPATCFEQQKRAQKHS
jgi:hypothetical protein